MTQRPDTSPPHPSDEPIVEVVVADDVLEEALDGEPVLDEDPVVEALAPTTRTTSVLSSAAAPVVVQAAAAAATGFVAGAATLALTRRHSSRGRTSIRRRGTEALPIVGTRSFLIDIHMLRSDG